MTSKVRDRDHAVIFKMEFFNSVQGYSGNLLILNKYHPVPVFVELNH